MVLTFGISYLGTALPVAVVLTNSACLSRTRATSQCHPTIRRDIAMSIEMPHPVASGATYEGRDRGVNPISVVTQCDWHSKGCGRPVTYDSYADPEG